MNFVTATGIAIALGLVAGCSRSAQEAPAAPSVSSQAVATSLPSAAPDQGPPQRTDWIPRDATQDIRRLLIAEAQENEKCRGGGGPESQIQAACSRRDQVDSQLTREGWCYGQDATSEADSVWAKCVDADKVFAQCLSEHARSDDLTSYDGGKSALRLLGGCRREFNIWYNRCTIQDGGTDGDCTLKAGVFAQSVLKLSGK
jgi:hypothetical protein